MRSQLRRMACYVAGVWAAVMFLAAAPLAAASFDASPTPPASITGGAWNADNTPIPFAKLRLRNVVTGKIRATTVADDAGQFVFSNIESGSYIVELVAENGKIVAIGRALTAGPGETVATFVRVGAKVPWFTGFFTNAAAVVASAAALTGVAAVSPEHIRPVSPEK